MKRIILLAFLAISVVACHTTKKTESPTANKPVTQTNTPMDNRPNEVTTPSGLKVQWTHKGTGKQPKTGDKVTVHYTGKLLNDTIFDSSVQRGQPFSFSLGIGQVIKGWDEGIAMLKEGDKAILTIPADIAYGPRAMGKIPANATLKFEVELLKVTEKVNAVPYDTKGKDTLKTASGLKYIIIQQGNGVKAESGKTVTVHYSGYLLDGKLFDSSVERADPISFPLGQGYVIKGWDEGIALLNIGTKARLIIPYALAYGEQGRPPVIPAKADLIFDVELLDVK